MAIIQRARLVQAQTIEPPDPPLGTGRPFGAFTMWATNSSVQPNTENFNCGLDSNSASSMVTRLNAARALGKKMVLAMTGGSHDQYLSVIDGVLKFDMAKWEARMDTYAALPAASKTVINTAITDGIIPGASVMDEPDNSSWGPAGWMTKPKIDQMVRYVKAIFPTMAVGVVLQYTFRPTEVFTDCDFQIMQYNKRTRDAILGSCAAYRDVAIAAAAANGVRPVFSMNILNGGQRITGCPKPATGGPGTDGVNCALNPTELLDSGRILGSAAAAVALLMWRYGTAYMADDANKAVFQTLATEQALKTTLSWYRAA